jgi:hypothetical protein
VCVYVSVLIYSAMSYNVYSGFFILYLIVVLYCIIHSCSYLSTIPVCTAWRHIVVGSSNHETGGFFQLIDTQLMPVVFLSLASYSFSSLCFLLVYETKNVLVKLTWTLRRSSLLFNSFIHSATYAQNEWEGDSPKQKNCDWNFLFRAVFTAIIVTVWSDEFMEGERIK